MALTAAQRQAAWRERRAGRAALLEAENARLAAELGSLRQECEHLAAELERLSGLACKHPAGAVDGGRCHACGSDVD